VDRQQQHDPLHVELGLQRQPVQRQRQRGDAGQRPQQRAERAARQAPAQQPAPPPMDDFADDDIPF